MNEPHPPHRQKTSSAPSSASVLWAAWRTGLKDLQNAILNPFPPGHVAQHEEPGSIANPTQLKVYQEKRNSGPGISAELGRPEPGFDHGLDRAASQAKYQQPPDQGHSR